MGCFPFRPLAMSESPLVVAISGPTCSGKTTLAKHLRRILRSQILHQDDFALPSEQIPIHPVHGVQDWDSPEGAIDWDKQRRALQHLRDHGKLPDDHLSHDHLNEQVPVPISDELVSRWQARFEELAQEGHTLECILADGFLLYWDRSVVRDFYDVRIFVREDYDVLKDRRENRSGYYTQSGSFWQDPPDYWDAIVWPAYIRSHAWMFDGGDVESGAVDTDNIDGLKLLEAGNMTMDELVNQSCQAIYDAVKTGTRAATYKAP